MKCKAVPVMAILKEFRAMNDGVRGRKGHRAADAPEYELGMLAPRGGEEFARCPRNLGQEHSRTGKYILGCFQQSSHKRPRPRLTLARYPHSITTLSVRARLRS